MKIYIGTSGFNYAYWKAFFYPEGMPARKWLTYYSTKYNSLELNSSFYRFPTVRNLKTMHDATPDDFIFTVKAQKIITHTRRMKDARDKVLEFKDIVVQGLGKKLGCILFQLPPSFKYSEENLDRVVESVPPDNHHAIEFRNESWWNNDAVLKALKKHKLTLCSVSFPNLPEDFHLTSNVFYLRMHGVPVLFKSPYSEGNLREIALKIPAAAKECYIYFNNTDGGAAIGNATYLRGLLDK